MFDLTEKVVVATGAGSSPIGRATVLLLAGQGASVIVSDVDDAAAVETAGLIVRRGGRAEPFACDVTKHSEIGDLINASTQIYGGIDILLGNAGYIQSHPLEQMTVDAFRRHLDINITANFVLAQMARSSLRARGGGSIVFTSSIAGFRGRRNSSAYNASKGGLINLTRSLADELAPDRIRVNCICPGWVATPANESALSDVEFSERLLDRIPQRRLAHPEEIAPAVLFLVSSANSYMTGESLVIDGGMLAT